MIVGVGSKCGLHEVTETCQSSEGIEKEQRRSLQERDSHESGSLVDASDDSTVLCARELMKREATPNVLMKGTFQRKSWESFNGLRSITYGSQSASRLRERQSRMGPVVMFCFCGTGASTNPYV